MLVLDIGGTKVAAARWTDGELHGRRQWLMPATLQGWRETLAVMARAYPEPDLVAAAVTGATDGRVLSAVNRQLISFWDGYALADALTQAWRCPAVLLNDAQAAAWGEFVASGRQPANLLFMTLSTGVGGGLVLDGQLRSGVRGLAGHIGHMGSGLEPLDGDTRCGCGRLNCLEALASGTALARQASHLLGRPLDTESVFAGWHAGDAVCRRLLERAAQAVAQALGDAHALLDLDEVRLGGSVGLALGMIDAIRHAQQALPARFRVAVSPARLGADAGLTGMGHWASNRLGAP
jgi:N-acylmannosamine kinase